MSSKDTGKKLTEQLILAKTKSHNLGMIKHLNLWGNDLEDLSIIQKMPNLQVISLSVNQIQSLKYFRGCQKLQELYLRKNNIKDLHDIKYLTELPMLKILWLHDNPCAQTNDYRNIVIKFLQHLTKLDNSPVTPEERAKSPYIFYNLGSAQPSPTPVQQKPEQIEQTKSIEADLQQESIIKQQKQEKIIKEEKTSNQSKWAKRASNIQVPIQSPFTPIQSRGHRKSQQLPKIKSKDKSIMQQEKQFSQKKNANKSMIGQQLKRNQNILMAVMSLMRQLDPGSLQIVKREADNLSRPR